MTVRCTNQHIVPKKGVSVNPNACISDYIHNTKHVTYKLIRKQLFAVAPTLKKTRKHIHIIRSFKSVVD